MENGTNYAFSLVASHPAYLEINDLVTMIGWVLNPSMVWNRPVSLEVRSLLLAALTARLVDLISERDPSNIAITKALRESHD